jgi:hypothetical protein
MARFRIAWPGLLLDWLHPRRPRTYTKLTRMLARHVNAWQQPYGPHGMALAVENKLVFTI